MTSSRFLVLPLSLFRLLELPRFTRATDGPGQVLSSPALGLLFELHHCPVGFPVDANQQQCCQQEDCPVQ
jgi:hypothetical protein